MRTVVKVHSPKEEIWLLSRRFAPVVEHIPVYTHRATSSEGEVDVKLIPDFAHVCLDKSIKNEKETQLKPPHKATNFERDPSIPREIQVNPITFTLCNNGPQGVDRKVTRVIPQLAPFTSAREKLKLVTK
ncbi:hypothetical protein LXL04_018575 [Taraxacum kok-saghyz]